MLDTDLEELRQEFDQLSKLKEKRKKSSTSCSYETCDRCSSSDELDRDATTTERERRKVVRKTRKAKQGKDTRAKAKAHESEEVAVKERQRINHSKPHPENGGQSRSRQDCRTTLLNRSYEGKYHELRDICESEAEEEIQNENYRMTVNYLQKYSAQEAENAPGSRPSPKRRKVQGNFFGFEGDNGKSNI